MIFRVKYLRFVWVWDFKKCDLKKIIFKNTVKRLTKSQFSLQNFVF
jgi:hypothetical protein